MTYIDDIADQIRRSVPPEALPRRDTSDLFRIYAVLALALGSRVQPANVHDAWVAWMAALDPDHPSLKPFDELAPDIRAQDTPFVDAIRRVAEKLSSSS